jgi:hypothetical protein
MAAGKWLTIWTALVDGRVAVFTNAIGGRTAMADRLSREERESRDELIYRLHLAGVSYRNIANRVGISKQAVHKIVQRELSKASVVHDDLEAEAETEHLERLSTLLAAQWPKAISGDSRAAEFCRRLMVDIARLKGLNTSVAERLAPLRGRAGDEFDDGEVDVDELEAWRKRRATLYEDDGPLGDAARAEARARSDREDREAMRRGITRYDLTDDDKHRLHAVHDVG